MAYSIASITRTAFSNPLYVAIASVAGLIFWIVTNTFDNILFFSPFLTFYVPNDMIEAFILTCINSVLIAILVNFNLYIIRNLKLKLSKSALWGTTISVISSTCASCSTFGFALASTFGGLGFLASNFLSSNQITLRAISTIVLLFAVCTCYIKTRNSCKLLSQSQVQGD
jgi:hypothetical protein